MAVQEALLSASFQVLFDRFAPRDLLDLIRGHDQDGKDLKRFEKTLMKVKAVLNDAEDKQFKNEAVKVWLEELKEAAYDAEDVLDEFATEALRRKLEAESQTISSQVLSLIPAPLNPTVRSFNDEIKSKIMVIAERFDDLAKEIFDLGLKEDATGSSSVVRETSSVVDESRVCGREDDKEKIIELLQKDAPGLDNKISVITIVGMGGVGKTTLAQIVYNNEVVEHLFDLKAWVCISEEFDVKRITKTILNSISDEAFDSNNLNLLQVKVKKALIGKKFLIVLDDMWSKNYNDWDVLQNPFRVGAPGSKIIVTTRNRDVALMMGTGDNHYLEHLSNDDCWPVLVQHAFGNRNIDTTPNLALIGKKIVEKCKGLPLAAKMLGGLLYSKQEEDEWNNILNSKLWELPETETDILTTLRLSYRHLPSHLKCCFAYCSIFPKGYEFEKMELVRLWMAEGLVQQLNKTEQMEDLGVQYFCELLSRSFFQVSSNNKSRFVMHDLINDLAQLVAGETYFKLEDKLEGKRQSKISKTSRHASYVGSYHEGIKKFEAFADLNSLRTFLALMTPVGSYLTNYVPLNLLLKLRSLRVLSLSGYCITELPSSIGDLIHIRYLDLSNTKLRSLPESTTTLYNLQTLILCYCSRMKKLPTEMRKLINLRHLDIKGANSIKEMPSGIGKLTSLRKLSNFIVGSNNNGSGIRELMNLNYLRRTLCISRLDRVITTWDAMEANLKDKLDLKELTMEWNGEFNDSRNVRIEREVLDMLRPHKKLKELTIKCYGGIRFPAWVGDPSFSDMVVLRLENCGECTALPPLGKLPLLKELCIKGMNKVQTVGAEFYGESTCPAPFPLLETLSFEFMEEWCSWFPCGVEVFPCLRELSIKRCPNLSGNLPDHPPSLEKLVIHECKRLSVPISSIPMLSELDIKECQEVVQRNMVDLSSLKSLVLSNISNLMCLTQGFVQGLTEVEDLEIVGCNELTSLWQSGARLPGQLTTLRRLRINGCPKLVSLVVEEQQQLGVPNRLESLELDQCINLEKVQGLHTLTSLRELTIKGCPRLVCFPKTGFLPSMLRVLKIQHCDALKSIRQATMLGTSFVSLESLFIHSCDSVRSIPRSHLPSTLKRLEIQNCKNLQFLLDDDEEELEPSSSPSTHSLRMHRSSNISSTISLLQYFSISLCPSLTSLSSRAELLISLKLLRIYGCPKLESVAERLHNNKSLELFQIWDCESLKSLPNGLCNLSHLHKVEIDKCPNLVSFPYGGLPAANLRELWIDDCQKLEALPDHIHNLSSLQQLSISYCPGIVSFPEEGFPTNLTLLRIIHVKICRPLPVWSLHRLISLRCLDIQGGFPDMVSFPEEEEEGGMMLPTSLTKLIIREFPNLTHLSSKGFQNLNSLEYLEITDCPKLRSFPQDGLPPSLLQLHIYRCAPLKQRCKKDQGLYWPIIAHIPCVKIDGRFIHD